MSRNSDLYTEDFYTWSLTTAAAIRNGEWQDLDAEMIAEEIEQLGISRAHALSSYLKQLTLHLLKWYYQPARRQTGHSWASSLVHARQEIAELLEENPGASAPDGGLVEESVRASPAPGTGANPAPPDHLSGYLSLDAGAGAR